MFVAGAPGFGTAVFVLAATPLIAGTFGDLAVGVVFVAVSVLLVGVRAFFATDKDGAADNFDAGL